MNCRDRFHAWGMGPRWPGATGRQCQVWEVTWTAQDESAQSRVLRDVSCELQLWESGPWWEAWGQCEGNTEMRPLI